MAAPLEGITVLDFTSFLHGPNATAMLADMGAEVIKVEARGMGDFNRGLALGGSFGAIFQSLNRGKKSITLDLRKTQGKEIVYKLVEKVDVVVENFRRGTMDRLGFDYETLARINPRLIYASASGFGPKGPMSDWPAFDIVAQAMGGIMVGNGEPGGEPRMVNAPPWICDEVGSMVFAYGIVLALLVRERLGVGQKLDESLLGTAIAMQPTAYCRQIEAEQPAHGERRRSSTFNFYNTSDGKWVAVAAAEPWRWPAFCRALGIEDLENDPRFADPGARGENWRELLEIVAEIFLSKTREEWIEVLHEHGLPCGPVYDYREAAAESQVIENDYLITIDDPVHGPIQMAGIPVQLSKTPGKVRGAAPALGENTEETLSGLGYTSQDLAELRAQEVI